MEVKNKSIDENKNLMSTYMKYYQFDLLGRTKNPQLNSPHGKGITPESSGLVHSTLRENISYPNKALPTGKINNIFVLDLDMKIKVEGEKKKQPITLKNHPFVKKFGSKYFTETMVVKTQSGGFHLYFKYDKECTQTTNDYLGTDIRSDGGYIVAPFSYIGDNPYENKYELVCDCEPIEVPEEIKEWIKEDVLKKKATKKQYTKKPKKFVVKNEDTEVEEFISYGCDLTQYTYNFKQKELELVIAGLPNSYFTDYSNWLIFTTAMKMLDEAPSCKIDTYALWDKYSKEKAEGNYDKDKNIINWNGIKDHKELKCLWNVFNQSAYNGSENILQYTMFKEVNTHTTKPDKFINKEKLGYDFLEQFKNPEEFGVVSEYKNVVIKSDTGTGKTTSFNHYIKKEKHNFISLVSRISLGQEQYNIFNQNGAECLFYQNVEGRDLEEEDNLVVQIDSIAKLSKGLYYQFYNDFVVYLDEFNSLVEYLITSPTLENKRIEVFYTLKELLLNCKQIICTDADISDTSLELLYIFGIDFTFIKNKYKHNKGVRATEINSRDHIINKLKKEKKFLCCCDSKTEAEIIYNELNDPSVILITSETKELPDFDKHDKIIYSPKVIYGIDSSMKRNVYCVYREHTIAPTAMVQQIARCRNINHLYFYFDKKVVSDYYFNSIEDCKEYLLEKDMNIVKNNWCMGQESDDYINLLVHFRYCKDAHNTNKFAHFINIIKQRGFIFTAEYKKVEKGNNRAKQLKENKEIKLENFDATADYVQRTNEVLKVPQEKIDDYKEIFIDNYKVKEHLNIKDYFLTNSLYTIAEEKEVKGENWVSKMEVVRDYMKYEKELEDLKDWNMNKATSRRGYLMFLNEVRKELTDNESPMDINVIHLPTPEREKELRSMYELVEYDRLNNDNHFKTLDKKNTKEQNIENYNLTLAHIYEKVFGKDIIDNKRVYEKQYDENGNVKTKVNMVKDMKKVGKRDKLDKEGKPVIKKNSKGEDYIVQENILEEQYNEDGSVKMKEGKPKIDYKKKTVYFINPLTLDMHDRLVDYSRKPQDKKYEKFISAYEFAFGDD